LELGAGVKVQLKRADGRSFMNDINEYAISGWIKLNNIEINFRISWGSALIGLVIIPINSSLFLAIIKYRS
jgi:hypothetical protein